MVPTSKSSTWSGHRAMTIMTHRHALGDRRSAASSSLSARQRLGLGRRFALVTDEIVGVLRPHPTLVTSRWLVRLDTGDQRATLRARTALARWNAEKTERRLLFDLRRQAAGKAALSMGWEGTESGSRTTPTEINITNMGGALRLLVIVAPLCLPIAGLTGVGGFTWDTGS
jgi:hypothetical protein